MRNNCKGQRVDCYAYLADLIDAVCRATATQAATVGVWFAERLEMAAARIREANKEKVGK